MKMVLDSYLNWTKNSVGIAPGNKLVYSPYFDSFLILVLFFAFSKLAVLISTRIILKLTKKTKTDVDDLIVERTNKPISFILLVVGFRLALLPLNMKASVVNTIENILGSLIVILFTYIAIVIIDILIDNWGRKVAAKTKSTFDDELVPVFHRFSRIFISLIRLLVILTAWGGE